MNFKWEITSSDVRKIRQIVKHHSSNEELKRRKAVNLTDRKRRPRKETFWRWMVCTRLTSAQRSGPESPVSHFMHSTPFPLTYHRLLSARNVRATIARTLKTFGGIRFTNAIARQLALNFDKLENGEWERALQQCDRLTQRTSKVVERQVAHYIDEFSGFGPKQSRNFLQALGLTRYEIPIDSRAIKWLNEFGFPIYLNSTGLADAHYYEFVLDAIQTLCAKSGIKPCILDAAIFANADGDSN